MVMRHFPAGSYERLRAVPVLALSFAVMLLLSVSVHPVMADKVTEEEPSLTDNIIAARITETGLSESASADIQEHQVERVTLNGSLIVLLIP